MKGLLLRLSALDADAATAVRVIAHFEALLGGPIDAVSLVRSTAGLAECTAGLELADGRTVRFGPDGTALPGVPGQVSGGADLGAAGRVWLERCGAAGPFDEIVLEWMGVAARLLGTRPRTAEPPHAADPALLELVLSEREAVEDRARALRLLGLAPELPLRVVAVAGRPGADAGLEAVALLGRAALPAAVRVARIGRLGVALVQRPDGGSPSPARELLTVLGERTREYAGREVSGAERATAEHATAECATPERAGRERVPAERAGREQAAPGHATPGRADRRPAGRGHGARPRSPARGVRAGVGGSTGALAAAASWAQARAALRFAVTDGMADSAADALAAAPGDAVADHDALGSLALLAEIPPERLRAQPDVRALVELAGSEGGRAAVAALTAFCRTGSLRQAAAELHLHHSSVAARLAQVESALGWRLRDPQDRFRAQLALYARLLAAAE